MKEKSRNGHFLREKEQRSWVNFEDSIIQLYVTSLKNKVNMKITLKANIHSIPVFKKLRPVKVYLKACT